MWMKPSQLTSYIYSHLSLTDTAHKDTLNSATILLTMSIFVSQDLHHLSILLHVFRWHLLHIYINEFRISKSNETNALDCIELIQMCSAAGT